MSSTEGLIKEREIPPKVQRLLRSCNVSRLVIDAVSERSNVALGASSDSFSQTQGLHVSIWDGGDATDDKALLEILDGILRNPLCGDETLDCLIRTTKHQRYYYSPSIFETGPRLAGGPGTSDNTWDLHTQERMLAEGVRVGIDMERNVVSYSARLFDNPDRFYEDERGLLLEPALRFSTRLVPDRGFHPNIKTTFSYSGQKRFSADGCRLMAAQELPKGFFFDQYQLTDLESINAGNLQKVVAIRGETDLELPVWMVKGWGSVGLFEVRVPGTREFDVDLEIPVHLRYHEPQRGESHVNALLPAPHVFWACPERVPSGTEPYYSDTSSLESFVRNNLPGHAAVLHFGQYNASHLCGARTQRITVPVTNLNHEGFVEYVSIGSVLAGFFIILAACLDKIIRKWRVQKPNITTSKKER